MCNVDFCEQMVRQTNPGILDKAKHTEAKSAAIHGYNTVYDIMEALNPFTGKGYMESLEVSRYTREMFCLMEGRHTHPSTLVPGGVSTTITHQTLTDYYVRLMKYIEYCKKVVPMHDDLYDFFYEALPGYERVGYRDTNLVCWGSFDDPEYCDYTYKNMTDWGRKRFITPGVVINGELLTTDLVEINLGIRILLEAHTMMVGKMRKCLFPKILLEMLLTEIIHGIKPQNQNRASVTLQESTVG
jgi:hydrogenase large subunit